MCMCVVARFALFFKNVAVLFFQASQQETSRPEWGNSATISPATITARGHREVMAMEVSTKRARKRKPYKNINDSKRAQIPHHALHKTVMLLLYKSFLKNLILL